MKSETHFRSLLALAGSMLIGIACARLVYGVSLTHVALLLIAGLIAFVGLAKPHQYGQLALLGLAVFGVAGTIIGVRTMMLGPPAPARPVEFVLSVAAAAVALTVARRRRAKLSSLEASEPEE